MKGSLALRGWESTAGENSRLAKLTNDQVREIRKLEGTKTAQELAEVYNVGRRTIQDVWRRRRYASVVG